MAVLFHAMKKAYWKKKIMSACETAGTYQPFFDAVIETLAGIMEMRDNAQEKFRRSGGNTIIMHTNKGGATNIVKNPAMVALMECNAQALVYWKELGLTSRSYKAMTGSLNVQIESKTFEAALAELGI